jgi:molybdopterin-guanine dinucleotide biosynthesis protein A
MGNTKALLPDRYGVRFIDRVAAALEPVVQPVVEVGGGYSRCATVIDRSLAGPARATWMGICWLCQTHEIVPTIVTACDLPLLSRRDVEWLVSIAGESSVVPVVGGRARFDCVLLGRATVAAIRSRPPLPDAAMASLFDPSETEFIDVRSTERANALTDCDTSEEYENLLR